MLFLHIKASAPQLFSPLRALCALCLKYLDPRAAVVLSAKAIKRSEGVHV